MYIHHSYYLYASGGQGIKKAYDMWSSHVKVVRATLAVPQEFSDVNLYPENQRNRC